MKLDSKYFDSIRIARRGEPQVATRRPSGACQWKGCSEAATHRAPKGRGEDGKYYRFCFDHVRQFNANYNYFEGMSKAEVEDFQKSAVIGHRPTWKLGENGSGGRGEKNDEASRTAGTARFGHQQKVDAHNIFEEEPASGKRARVAEARRSLKTLEKRALASLHLGEDATKDEIKARFKELVKRHHPDANGGDRGSEEKLREIIQAYNYLKQAGLV